MTGFRCWSVRNVLDLYADGRLTEPMARRVDAHLSACAACAAAAAEAGSVPRLLKKSSRVRVPEGLASSVLKKMETGAEQSPQASVWTSLPGISLPQTAALAYLALVLILNLRPGAPSQGQGIAPPWAQGDPQ